MWWRVAKFINYLTTTLVVILFLSTLLIVIFSVGSDDDPNLFGYQIKTVLSGSMEPDIQTGSVIVIQQVADPTDFREDDIITYRVDDILITHRIIKAIGGGQRYETKGDNNNASDVNPIESKQVIGLYTGITIPYVGYAVSFAQSSKGVVLLLIIPGILLFLYSVIFIWRTCNEEGLKGKIQPKKSSNLF